MTLKVPEVLDDRNRRILGALQRHGRMSLSELARRVHLSQPSVTERVRRLEDAGIIVGYSAKVDPERLGFTLTAFVTLTCPPARYAKVMQWAHAQVEVRELHHVAGGGSFVLKVMVANMRALEGLVEAASVFGTTQTTIVFSSPVVKTVWELPEPHDDRPQDFADTP